MIDLNNKNIEWINTGRALCMIFVYIAHCNFYYQNHISPFYFIYKPFYLSFFFFLSGFLFFKDLDNFPYYKKIKNIACKLIWPAIVFPSLIWIPKAFAHSNEVSVYAYLIDIFGGTAAWFVSTLIIAQLLSLVLIKCFKTRLSVMLVISFVTMLSAFALHTIQPEPFPWYYKSGMIALFFLVLGGLTRKYYHFIARFISTKYFIISAVIYLGLMLYNYYYLGYFQAIMSVKYDNIPLGIVSNLLGIFFMLQLSHALPIVKWIQYIGKNSLLFYFFGGGVPLVVGQLAMRFIPFDGYLMTAIVTMLCLALLFPISYVINRYLPWLLDFSLIIKRINS